MQTFLFPRSLDFGSGVRTKLPERIAQFAETPNVALIASASALRTAPGQDILNAITPLLAVTCTDVEHDPSVETVDRIRRDIDTAGANLIVALGGGSVLDTAKTAAALAGRTEPAAAFLRGEIPMPARPALPCIALPTTAGTGAESTKNAVLTDPGTHKKLSLRSDHMLPVAALCDPDFLAGCPKTVIAASGMDALTQAVESYCSKNASTLTRALAAQAARILLDALPNAACIPDDTAAREQVAEASMLTGLAFAASGLGSVHGLAHPLGHRLGLPHGFVCAVLLPHCIRLNIRLAVEQNRLPLLQTVQTLADACACPTPDDFVERLDSLRKLLGFPDSFAKLGLTPAHIPYILQNCRSGSMKANPVELSDDILAELLRTLA